jgi:protein-L-isoaspartate(D-aspartate) O-methyltransferase
MTLDRRSLLAAGLASLAPGPASAQRPADAAERRGMVDAVQRMFRETPGPGLPTTMSRAVTGAMLGVPRHEFVPAGQRSDAYENRPLPIGYGQTISQPYIVALMTELAQVSRGERALEIGTGSGYQAAILAAMGAKVYTIEIVPELGRIAGARLQRQRRGVEARIGDGYFGWREAAPFDAILVTAAASHVPPPLVQQLKPGGRMVIPVGPPFVVQQLVLVTKDPGGRIRTRQLLPVSFVPLTRGR